METSLKKRILYLEQYKAAVSSKMGRLQVNFIVPDLTLFVIIIQVKIAPSSAYCPNPTCNPTSTLSSSGTARHIGA